MPKIVLPQKDPDDTIATVFDFSSYLPLGATVSSAVCTSVVYSGTDPTPSAVISGSPTVASPQVTQDLTGGLEGVTYLISCAATLSDGSIVTLSGFLAVLEPYI